MFVYFPFRERFEFDPDEGYEAMKAFLVVRGYPLYSEIWSDQPPLFTYLLATCIRAFGPDINAARTLVLIFSAILMAAIAHFLRTTWGLPHALAGTILVFLLPFYNTLSVSVMVAVPILTFALLSLLALSAWHKSQQDRWLVLSALVLALSVLTKLIIAFLAPIFVLGILFDARARLGRNTSWLKVLRPAILWCLVFVIVLGGLGLLLVGPANIGQLLSTHLAASQSRTYIARANANPIIWHLGDSWPILLLAIPGCLFVLLERHWTSLYLLAWFAVAYLMLSAIVPVWYHYQHLVSIPAAMLAAIAAGEALRQLLLVIRSRAFFTWRFSLAVIALASFLIALNVRYPLVQPSFDRPPIFVTHGAHVPWPEQMFLTKMTNHAPATRWVVTDLPIYAFRVGLPVPPYLAVSSGKRFVTGALTEKDLIDFVKEYNPEQVLTGYSIYPNLEKYLGSDYRLLYSRGKRRLYLREDLKGQQ
jgi:4-amino-4-deoxy-L-arabinose transferase-like glycosyltransferase